VRHEKVGGEKQAGNDCLVSYAVEGTGLDWLGGWGGTKPGANGLKSEGTRRKADSGGT